MALQRAVIVDTRTQIGGRSKVMADIIDADATTLAEEYIGTLPDPETGRYQIDVSERCGDCGEWHSPEAECEVAT